VNSFVPSGTAPLVRLGTRSPCFRGPESPESSRSSTACGVRNFTNLKSFGFFLTDRAFSTSVDRHPQSSRPDKTSALLSREASHHTTKSKQLNQYLTNRPIRQCDFVFGDTRMYASVRATTRSSSAPISNLHRHTKLLRKSRRGELANPGVLISWAAGHINAILTLYVRARHASNEGAVA
jgi:hypothetical protein